MGRRLGIGRVFVEQRDPFSLSQAHLQGWWHYPFVVAFYLSEGFWRQPFRLQVPSFAGGAGLPLAVLPSQ